MRHAGHRVALREEGKVFRCGGGIIPRELLLPGVRTSKNDVPRPLLSFVRLDAFRGGET